MNRYAPMYSIHHFLVSVLVGSAVAFVLPAVVVFGQPVPVVLLVVYAAAIGVLIDLDHFVIARVKTGSWEAIRFCLSNPASAVADQSSIFEAGDVGELSRLFSHVVIVGLAVALTAVVDPSLAILTAVVLYVHVLTDLGWDIYRWKRLGIEVTHGHART